MIDKDYTSHLTMMTRLLKSGSCLMGSCFLCLHWFSIPELFVTLPVLHQHQPYLPYHIRYIRFSHLGTFRDKQHTFESLTAAKLQALTSAIAQAWREGGVVSSYRLTFPDKSQEYIENFT